MPPRLLSERWALTPPFHPYPPFLRMKGGIFSVALSVVRLRSQHSRVYPDVKPGYAASCPVVFGLSSLDLRQERFSTPLKSFSD